MAAAGAVSGMPEGAAASLPSAFLPGAAKRSHRLGSRPVPARSRAPEPPPGSPSRARSRSPSPRLEISLPSPLAGMVTGPQLGPDSAGLGGHPARGWSPPSLSFSCSTGFYSSELPHSLCPAVQTPHCPDL